MLFVEKKRSTATSFWKVLAILTELEKNNWEEATTNFAFYPLLLADLISLFPGRWKFHAKEIQKEKSKKTKKKRKGKRRKRLRKNSRNRFAKMGRKKERKNKGDEMGINWILCPWRGENSKYCFQFRGRNGKMWNL